MYVGHIFLVFLKICGFLKSENKISANVLKHSFVIERFEFLSWEFFFFFWPKFQRHPFGDGL